MKRKNRKKWWLAVALVAAIGIGIYQLPLKKYTSTLKEEIATFGNDSTFAYKRFEHIFDNKKAVCRVPADYPVSGPSHLKDAIKGVLYDLLGQEGNIEEEDIPTAFSNNPELANKQLKLYVENVGMSLTDEVTGLREKIDDDDFRNDMTFEWAVDFTVNCETPKYVTYNVSWLTYRGGLHELAYDSGITFRKADGLLMSWDDVLADEHYMQDIIKSGLKKYFNVTSDEELLTQLTLCEDFEHLPLPNTPIFEKDSLAFIYQFYEISAWGMGQPKFKVAYEDLAPQMKSEALELARQ